MNRDLLTSHQQPQSQQRNNNNNNNRDELLVVAPTPRRGGVAAARRSSARRPPSSFKSSDTLDSIAENHSQHESNNTCKPIRRKSSQDLNIDLGIFHQEHHVRQPRRASDGNHHDEIGPPIFLEVDFDDDDDSLVDMMDECTLGGDDDDCTWDEREITQDDDDESDSSDDSDSMYDHSHANDSRRLRTIARPNKLMNSDSFASHDSSNWSQCMTMMERSERGAQDLRNNTIHNRGGGAASSSDSSLPRNIVMKHKKTSINTRNGSFYSKNSKNRRTIGASSSIKIMTNKMNRSDSFSTIGSNMTAAQEANPQRFLTPANSFTAAANGGGNNNDVDDHDHVVNHMTCDLAAMTTRDFPVVQPVRSTVDARKFQMHNRTMFKLPFGSSSSDLSHMVTNPTHSSSSSAAASSSGRHRDIDVDDDGNASQASTMTSSSSLSFLAQKKYQRPSSNNIESPFASPNPAVMTPSPKMSSPIRLPFRRGSGSSLLHVPNLDHDNDNHHHQVPADLLLGSLSSPSSSPRNTGQHQAGPSPTSMSPNTRFGGLRRKESIHRL
jgi:hypothetical protein